MIRSTLVAAVALSSACVDEVDTDSLEPIADYSSWARFETRGDVPPHSDGLRIIYANEAAVSYTGAGEYPVGSVLVKEIYDDDEQDIRYIAVMRRLETAPSGGELEGRYPDRRGGWLFTRLGELGDAELQGVTCWQTCHVQAPFAGAWYDYGGLLRER